jgi:hypothetical protein
VEDEYEQLWTVEGPIETALEIEEPNVDPEPFTTEVLTDAPLTLIFIEGGNRKGGVQLVDSLGFKYVKKRTSRVAVTWACRAGKRCPATVRQTIDGDSISRPRPHNHESKPGETLNVTARAAIRSAAKEDVFSSSTEIVNRVIDGLQLQDNHTALPKLDSLIRTANRVRARTRPHHPATLDFTVDSHHIPDGFLQADVSQEDQRHIILATNDQFSHLSRAKVWYIDGTFKVVREPFMQLPSVHSFIRSGDCMKQVPLCFVLMSRRKKTDYRAVIQAVLSHLPSEPAVRECVLDFERSMWSGLQATLPDVSLHGCWFHWTQAIYRQVKKRGLQAAYCHQMPIRDYIRQLMALPHLPSGHIPEAFTQLKLRCPDTCPSLKKFWTI